MTRRLRFSLAVRRLCPERDTAVGLVLPAVLTKAMDLCLAEFGRTLPPKTHAVLVLDRAGWHTSRGLEVPANLTLAHLPPYSPELRTQSRSCGRTCASGS